MKTKKLSSQQRKLYTALGGYGWKLSFFIASLRYDKDYFAYYQSYKLDPAMKPVLREFAEDDWNDLLRIIEISNLPCPWNADILSQEVARIRRMFETEKILDDSLVNYLDGW